VAQPTNDQLITTTDGRRITYTRWRYEETVKQERILAQVNDLVMNQASSALSVGARMGQQEYGGLLRVVIPQLIDQYGKVNATAAVKFYDQTQLAWLTANAEQARQSASRGNVRRKSERVARARTQSAIQLAQTSVAEFSARFADTYKLAERSESVIGLAMKIRARDGHEPSVEAMNNALTREVASYHRDTVLFNAALDPNVSRVQRVAQASACEFCRLMALGSTDGKVRVSNYAVKFHDHCHCTIQPLFTGEDAVRPDYYDQFEKEYSQARKDAGSGRSQDVLAEMRRQSKQPVTKPVNSDSSFFNEKSNRYWTKEYEQGQTRAEYVREFNSEVRGLQGKTELPTNTAYARARTTPLEDLDIQLPKLDNSEDLLDAYQRTNPKYDPAKRDYSSNCARVVQAYELRRRGFDVTASKASLRDGSQAAEFYGNAWRHPETGRTVYQELADRGTRLDNGEWSNRSYTGRTTREDYAQRLKDTYPPGSRGIIQVQWANAKVGHVFNFEVKANGKVIFVDAQTGKLGLDDYFERAVLYKSARLDDKTPMAGVLQYVKGYER
jgi:hypothetical protein